MIARAAVARSARPRAPTHYDAGMQTRLLAILAALVAVVALDHVGQGSERCRAPGLESREYGALGGDRGAGGVVVES